MGFDLLSLKDLERRCIEVKGRAGVGAVELTWSEYAKSVELGEDYWLYVCSTAHPQPHVSTGSEPCEGSCWTMEDQSQRSLRRECPSRHRRCTGGG